MTKLKKNSSHREKWFRAMRKKLGVTTNAEVRAYMSRQGKKATIHGHGYFYKLAQEDPEKLKEISRQAANKRFHDV